MDYEIVRTWCDQKVLRLFFPGETFLFKPLEYNSTKVLLADTAVSARDMLSVTYTTISNGK